KRYKGELRDLDLWSASQRFLGHLAEEKSLGADRAEVRERAQATAAEVEAEEASVEAERLGVSEEASELSIAKDDLFALSNKAQLDVQRAHPYEEEAAQLAAGVEAARREIDELGARARVQAGEAEELAGQLEHLDAEADERARRCDEEGRAHEALRA